MIKVLHTLPALDGGGAERIVYDYCIRMMDEFQFDFIVHTEDKGILENELEKRGCRIFHIPPLHRNKRVYKARIQQILREGEYDIIHVSQGYRGIYFLKYAKKYGIPVRIAHSHMAYIPESGKEKAIRRICTRIVKHYATDLFACGEDAAKWMWGKKILKMGNVKIMTNAIQADKFSYAPEERQAVQKELGIEGKFVLGNVARFSYQKNHEFLLRMFKLLRAKKENAVLLLIGRGELYAETVAMAKELGIAGQVLFLGVRSDVPRLLNAMDLFVLPSRFEGLPVTLVEIQANGLGALVSDTVTDEIRIANNVIYMPLAQGEERWAEACQSFCTERIPNAIKGSEYDIDFAVDKIRKFYKETSRTFKTERARRERKYWKEN